MSGCAVHADHLDHLADRFAGADRHTVLLRLLFHGPASSGGRVFAPARFRLRLFRGAGGRVVTAFYSFRLYFLVFHGEEAFRQGSCKASTIKIITMPCMTPMRQLTKRMWATTPTKRFRLITTTAWPPDGNRTKPHGWCGCAGLLAIPSVIIVISTIAAYAVWRLFKDAIFITAEHGEALDEMHEEVPWCVCDGTGTH